MIIAPNSKSERLVAVCMKIGGCVLAFAAAVGLLYFAFEGLGSRIKDSTVPAIFFALVMLFMSGTMFLFLYGAAKMSIEDYAIQVRILRRYGFLKVKHMTTEEFDRLSKIEYSIDEDILERTKKREKLQ